MITYTRLNGRGCLDVQKVISQATTKDGELRYPSLGFGLSAHVYDMKTFPGHVLKIAYDDPSYIQYLKYIEKHPNRLVPKVLRAWVDEEQNASVTVLERLESIIENDSDPTCCELQQSAQNQFSALQRVLTFRERMSNKAYKDSLKVHKLEHLVLSRYEANQILGMDRINVMEELIRIAHANEFAWDLHGANVMRRVNTGELVVTDPWVTLEYER